MKNFLRIVMGICLFALVGCSPAPTPADPLSPIQILTEEPQQSNTTPVSSPNPSTPEEKFPMPPNSPLQNLIDQAKKELANQLSVPVDNITLVEASAVTWSDSSLGCPQPGMAYLQVLTPGYRIVLSHNNKTFEYHADRRFSVFLCENPSMPLPGTPDNT